MLDIAGSGTGTLGVVRLQNTVAAANNSATELLFAANRSTGGLTNVAGIAGMITDVTNTAYKGALVFSTADNAAPAERMRINSSGNVGVGTTSPSGRLHVVSAAAGEMLVLANSGGTNAWQVGAGTDDRLAILYNQLEKVTIKSDGSVGIGTVPGNILTVVQNSSTDPIADAWTTYSSIRWKDNVSPLSGALKKIQQLRAVYFEWKQTKKRDLGLIAEEVGKVIPEIVAYEENGQDAKSIDYGRLTAILVEAIKEQQTEIKELQKQIAALKQS